jgi:hypothetical protein
MLMPERFSKNVKPNSGGVDGAAPVVAGRVSRAVAMT